MAEHKGALSQRLRLKTNWYKQVIIQLHQNQ